MSGRRVRIAGAGVVAGSGRGLPAFWRALRQAEPGLAPHSLGDARLEARYVAVPSERDTSRDDLTTHLLELACQDAVTSFGAPLADRVGLFVGSSLGGMSALERLQRRARGVQGGLAAPDLPLARGLYDGPTNAVAERLGAFGLTVNTACSSAANALGVARRWLLHRRIDMAIVAGADVVSPFVYAGFQCLGALDPQPTTPFAAQRRGLNLGEAAVAFVLVRPSDAPRPGVDVTGYASSCDAHHLTRPDLGGHGLRRAIDLALADADIGPADLAAVSAHATGTLYNDTMEAAAFAGALGEHRPAVHCTKPVTGHTLGASGAVDALAMVLALEHRILPKTFVRGELDRELPIRPATAETILAASAYVLSTSSGFGGANAALIFQRSDA